jgi:hypothetical protein
MSKESYVQVKEVIMTAPNTSISPGVSSIGGVIVSEVGPRVAFINSPSEFLENYTIDGVTVPRDAHTSFINAYYQSYSSSLVISRALNTTATSGLIWYEDTEPINVIYKDGDLMSKKTLLTLQFEDPILEESSFVLNDTVFHKGEIPADIYEAYQRFSQFVDIDDIVATLEGWDDVHCTYSRVDEFNYELTLMHTPSIGFKLSENPAETIGMTLTLGATEDAYTVPAGKLPLFSLSSMTPSGADTIKAMTHKNEVVEGIKQFYLSIDAGEGNAATGDYLCSLNQVAVDINGQGIFIDYLNTMGLDLSVEVFEGVNKLAPIESTIMTAFGNSGMNLEESAKNAYLMKALDFLQNQELFDIEYLSPFGITQLPYVKRYVIVGSANNWFTPIDCPPNATNLSQIKRYFNDLGVEGSNILALGCFDRNVSLTGWINLIACSTLYYERVMANLRYGAEFAPVFKNEFGTVNMTNPTRLLLREERQELLDLAKRINWVVYNQRTQSYYLNDNVTHQVKTDIVSEEQNRRLVNKVNKDLVRILDQFIGRFNTRQTRLNVTDVIEMYLRKNIMNQKFPPNNFQIVCDETNNPASIITENKLAVTVRLQLYNAIKYIEVLNEVFPLSVAFTSGT